MSDKEKLVERLRDRIRWSGSVPFPGLGRLSTPQLEALEDALEQEYRLGSETGGL